MVRMRSPVRIRLSAQALEPLISMELRGFLLLILTPLLLAYFSENRDKNRDISGIMLIIYYPGNEVKNLEKNIYM